MRKRAAASSRRTSRSSCLRGGEAQARVLRGGPLRPALRLGTRAAVLFRGADAVIAAAERIRIPPKAVLGGGRKTTMTRPTSSALGCSPAVPTGPTGPGFTLPPMRSRGGSIRKATITGSHGPESSSVRRADREGMGAVSPRRLGCRGRARPARCRGWRVFVSRLRWHRHGRLGGRGAGGSTASNSRPSPESGAMSIENLWNAELDALPTGPPAYRSSVSAPDHQRNRSRRRIPSTVGATCTPPASSS